MKILVLGSQGSGKSTQARMLAQKLAVPYVEMGQILRDKTGENTTEAQVIKEALEIGDLVADSITIKAYRQRIKSSDCQNGYVLDGYPRNYTQLQALEKDIDKVFLIKVRDQEGITRLIDRGRHDDNLASITRRLQLFHKESEPLISYFAKLGKLEEIDGQKSIEAVHQDILKRLKS